PWTQDDIINLNGPVVFGNGVEEYTYIDTITFPTGGNYNMWYEDCCRNCAIINIINRCGYSFHLYTHLWADSTNSSPVFLNPPIPIAQLGIPFYYNPLPFDADGDSIAWQLDTPVTTTGTYVGGYTIPPSDTAMPFTMDPVTGVVSFIPNTLGHFEVSVLVNEYRNGVQIGQIRRDMQIIVVLSANTPAMISSTASGSAVAPAQFNLNPSVPFTLSVSALDLDNETITMTGRGEPFLLANNPASVAVNSYI